ncbi:hypothetical protein ALPR1_12640 [Algoriphagus machipongonensis]|uniref:Lipoprotein n=1 Tax=Algoriphagus machipongonensis TaxID=388413 RepID=A3HT99_9BACT|nr:hypothetical protein ALPR1_12640 [Algoriphagus machipongonensis]
MSTFNKSFLLKTNLLAFILIATLIFSCKDVGEPSPNSRIEGTYQHSLQGKFGWEDKEYRYVNILKFKPDGTVNGENYTTEVGSDEILGYRGYFSGFYSISEGKVTISYDEIYRLDYTDITYVAKESLSLIQNEDNSVEYFISEDFSKLFSSKSCQPNENCAIFVYEKVD